MGFLWYDALGAPSLWVALSRNGEITYDVVFYLEHELNLQPAPRPSKVNAAADIHFN